MRTTLGLASPCQRHSQNENWRTTNDLIGSRCVFSPGSYVSSHHGSGALPRSSPKIFPLPAITLDDKDVKATPHHETGQDCTPQPLAMRSLPVSAVLLLSRCTSALVSMPARHSSRSPRLRAIPFFGEPVSSSDVASDSHEDGLGSVPNIEVEDPAKSLDQMKPEPVPGLARRHFVTDSSSALKRTGNDPRQHDSIELLAADMTKVLTELRPRSTDSRIHELLRSRQDHDNRFSRWLAGLPSKPLFNPVARVSPPLIGYIIGTELFLRLIKCSKFLKWPLAKPTAPLAIATTFLTAVLTMRWKLSRDRANALETTTIYARDMAQQLAFTVYPHHPVLALKLGRHLALLPWLNDPSPDDVAHALLSPADADYILEQRKPSVAVLARLRQVLRHLARDPSSPISIGDQLSMDRSIQRLNQCVAKSPCRVLSARPLVWLYLTGLSLMWRVPALLGAVVVALWQPARGSKRDTSLDVADAFCCPPPLLQETSGKLRTSRPSYWDEESR